MDPIEVGRKLVLYSKQLGNEDMAVRELVDLHRAYLGFGMKDEAVACLKDALQMQPFNQSIKDRLDALDAPERTGEGEEEKWPPFEAGAAGPGAEREAWPSVEAPPAEEQPWPGEAEEQPWPAAGPGAEEPQEEEGKKSPEELMTEADVFLKYGLYTEARAVLEKLKVEDPQNVEVHIRLKSLYRDVDDAEQAVAECLALSALALRSGDADRSRAFLAEAFEINPDDPRLQGRAEGAAGAPPEKPAGAPGPAPRPFEPPAEEAQAPPPPEPASDFESMLSDLDKEFASPDVGEPEVPQPPLETEVADIFEEFKRGLAKEIEAEDAETHYNLGIAYKEMGLVDDSIKEFQVSKVDPKYYVQSMTMLGICYMEKGLHPLAVEAFSGALVKVGKDDDTALSIKYDLAEAYEKTGKMSEALDLYTQVYGWNARFRNVSEKINLLRSPASPQEKPRAKKSRVSYL
jgi:tetratricopeptide (TPR) repeat protein